MRSGGNEFAGHRHPGGVKPVLSFALMAAALTVAFGTPTANGNVTRSGGYSYVTEHADLNSGKTRALKAPCPGGTRVLSGGSYNSGGFDTGLATHSFPFDGGDRGKKPDDGWKVLWTTEADVQITTNAICADKQVRYEKNRQSMGPGASRGGFSGGFCEDGRFAYGGGSSGPIRAAETMSYLHQGDLWRVIIDQTAEAAESHVRTFSVCAKPQPSLATAANSAAAGTQASTSAVCPPGTRVVGGGVFNDTPAFGANRQALIAASQPFGFRSNAQDGWHAYIDNHRPSTAVNFTVQALCLPPA